MQFQYVSSVMNAEDFSGIFPDASIMPGQQIQKFHRLMVEGLAGNGVKVRAVSSIPITSANYPHRMYKGGHRSDGKMEFRYLPVLNIPVIKPVLQMLGAFFSILFVPNAKEQVVVCDVLNASVARGAIQAARLRGIPCAGIITDLPDMMVGGSQNERYTQMVRRNITGCTHYVLLTEQMNEVVNPEHKPYVIIEGLCDIGMKTIPCTEEREEKSCLYAGLLDARYGVKKMVEAFVQAGVDGAKLHLFGTGSYTDELISFTKSHPEIIYHGTVLNTEVVQKEMQVSLLVNPRPTTEEFTKYSFPSKNMEYMASGTPVLTTNLPGMPKEYQRYVYMFDDETVEGMAQTFRNLLGKSEIELSEMGVKAKKFVMEEKNNIAVGKKMIELFDNNKQATVKRK